MQFINLDIIKYDLRIFLRRSMDQRRRDRQDNFLFVCGIGVNFFMQLSNYIL